MPILTATLLIHICAARRAYRVTFSSQAQAIAFLEARKATHTWDEIPGLHGEGLGSVPIEWHELINYLYPLCEHGMSLDLCHGPMHFMSAAQEQAMDWAYSDAPSGF
jgi:hypothetical protein